MAGKRKRKGCRVRKGKGVIVKAKVRGKIKSFRCKVKKGSLRCKVAKKGKK
jgi:hypothetical protein